MKIRIHPLRIFLYALIMAGAVTLYVFLHSYFLMVVMVLLVVLPIITISAACYMGKYLQLQLLCYQPSGKIRDSIDFGVKLTNSFYWMAFDCGFSGMIGNPFYGDSSPFHISMSVPFHGQNQIKIPLVSKYSGLIQITLTEMNYEDLLCLISFSLSIDTTAQSIVLPQYEALDKTDFSGYMVGVNESEESPVKGSDFSEITEIREYHPGDLLKDIHWKLSAKKDELMVKQRESVSQSQILLLPELYGSRDTIEQIITYTYELGCLCISMRTPVRLMWWNSAAFDFVETLAATEDEMKIAMGQLFHSTIWKKREDLNHLMRTCRPMVRAYVLIQESDGDIDGKVITQG